MISKITAFYEENEQIKSLLQTAWSKGVNIVVIIAAIVIALTIIMIAVYFILAHFQKADQIRKMYKDYGKYGIYLVIGILILLSVIGGVITYLADETRNTLLNINIF
ncbi:Uncharacterised protein [Mycoplasmopsis columboralis]|uniref:Uncharacterized protein n=1 Tax=Mycoplasmopsis columboralis TaxID=171282 RepID=A0A449B5I2_9BACT|nr:hypothetical protein [Mycoplasmopsis columboralis]VEU75864.1 Uncharacterised protein [Mycoplasmopsis columboralis]